MNALTATILLLTASPALSQDEVVGARVREWFSRMSGTLEGDDGSGNLTRIDLASDLGLGDRNLTTEVQVYGRIPVLGRIYAGWWRARDSGDETLTRTVDFDGVTFSESDRVRSDVSLDVGYLTYEFVFPTIPLGDLLRAELGVELGVRGFHGAGSIDDSLSGQSGRKSGTVGLPVLGVHASVELFTYVRAEAELIGLEVRYGPYSLSYLETSAELDLVPLPWLFAGVGYKLAKVDLHHSGSQVFGLDVGISGLFVTAGIRF